MDPGPWQIEARSIPPRRFGGFSFEGPATMETYGPAGGKKIAPRPGGTVKLRGQKEWIWRTPETDRQILNGWEALSAPGRVRIFRLAGEDLNSEDREGIRQTGFGFELFGTIQSWGRLLGRRCIGWARPGSDRGGDPATHVAVFAGGPRDADAGRVELFAGPGFPSLRSNCLSAVHRLNGFTILDRISAERFEITGKMGVRSPPQDARTMPYPGSVSVDTL